MYHQGQRLIFNLIVILHTANLGWSSESVEIQEAPDIFKLNPKSDSLKLSDFKTSAKSSCTIYRYVGPNDLSLNDIVVKSQSGNTVCMKARFSMAIKVEAESSSKILSEEDEKQTDGLEKDSGRITLGYLPLDSVVSVKDNCPEELKPPTDKEDEIYKPSKSNQTDAIIAPKEDPDELKMIVSFECGKFAFKFKREKNFYLSSIVGVVSLDSKTVKEFVSEKPMFFTSDLTHHFKHNDLIEVESTDKSKAFFLTANFYNLEFEVFRKTTSRDFVKPADEDSRIYESI